MKKVLLIAALTAVSFAGFAQDKKEAKKFVFSAGVEAALPIGDFADAYSFGIGGTVQGAYNVASKTDITLNAGFISYSGKTVATVKVPSLNVIPVMAGLRYGFTDKLYAHGQAGMSFWSSKVAGISVNESDFTWNLGVGYFITENIDAAIKFNSIGTAGTASNAVGLRIAYNF